LVGDFEQVSHATKAITAIQGRNERITETMGAS
jgi:hypothetical protein